MPRGWQRAGLSFRLAPDAGPGSPIAVQPSAVSSFRPVLLALIAAALGATGCDTAPTVAAATDDAAWTTVGDAACASCHADISATYARSGMGRSMSRFARAGAPEHFDAQGRSPVVCAPSDATEGAGYCYQAFVRGDTLFQRETHPDEPGFERVSRREPRRRLGQRDALVPHDGRRLHGAGRGLPHRDAADVVRRASDLGPQPGLRAGQPALRAPDHARVPHVPRRRAGPRREPELLHGRPAGHLVRALPRAGLRARRGVRGRRRARRPAHRQSGNALHGAPAGRLPAVPPHGHPRLRAGRGVRGRTAPAARSRHTAPSSSPRSRSATPSRSASRATPSASRRARASRARSARRAR